MVIGLLTTLARCRRASVTTVAALVLPAMIGMVGLVAEYGHGLLSKVENQRVAARAHSAVDVTVATQAPLLLSQILGSGPNLAVSSTGYAELVAGTPACIIALKQG